MTLGGEETGWEAKPFNPGLTALPTLSYPLTILPPTLTPVLSHQRPQHEEN